MAPFSANAPLFLSPAHDEAVCALVIARFVTACRLTPWSHRVASTGGLAFTASVRMVHGIHGNATIDGTATHPALASCFADRDVFVVQVSDLSNRRHAINQYLAGLARRQLNQCILFFFGHKLSRASSGANHLRTLARPQLDVVNDGAGGNIPQRQRVAYKDVSFRTADDLLSDLQSLGMQDVPLFAIGVSDQRNARRTVRIIFDRNHGAGDSGFVALEINYAQLALVPAAAMPARDIARIPASAGALLDPGQRLMRSVRGQLFIGQCGHGPQ